MDFVPYEKCVQENIWKIHLVRVLIGQNDKVMLAHILIGTDKCKMFNARTISMFKLKNSYELRKLLPSTEYFCL